MSDRVTVGDMPLDQPDPIDVGDVIAWTHLPREASELADWLAKVAGDWLDCELRARPVGDRPELFVAAIDETPVPTPEEP